MNQVLVVDDEIGIRELLSEILGDEGYTVRLAENASQARALRKEARPDLVLLDIWMPDMDGISLLKEWAASGLLTMPVVMMSGHGTIDSAVEATRLGAVDFLEKPISLPKLLATVNRALAGARIQQRPPLTFANLGKGKAIQELKSRLEQVSRLKGPLLLTGEPGSGFELCARLAHLPNTPWVAPTDNAWLGDNPFDKLREAQEGTLFLGDVAELSRAEQKGLMQLISKLDKFNVRLVCAAQQRLPDLVSQNRFDPQLYARLSAVTVAVPALREHPEDIPELAATMLAQMVEAGEVGVKQFSTAALNALRNLDWPGNLPVLNNAVRTLALTSLSSEITAEDVARIARDFSLSQNEALASNASVPLDQPLREAREQFEHAYFSYHIRKEYGNMSRVAERVGLERTHLYRKLKQLGIRPPGRGED